MTADRWMLLLTLGFVCVSSHDEPLEWKGSCEEDLCDPHTLMATLGSSVLLPCNFTTRDNTSVTWAHVSQRNLVHLKSGGRVNFLDHRFGRLKVFPNQASEGNYSLRLDGLTEADLGCYCCKRGEICHRVELSIKQNSQSDDIWLLLVISAAVAALILLCVGGYCCCRKCTELYTCETEDNENNFVRTVSGAVVSFPVEVDNHLVYENNDQCPEMADHSRNYAGPSGALQNPFGSEPPQSIGGIYPNLSQFKFQRVESRKTRQSFHREFIHRLQKASLRRHYYVNQEEIRMQQTMTGQKGTEKKGGLKKKKGKENCEYKNPIYNRSRDQLAPP